jgi:hypothetical protein
VPRRRPVRTAEQHGALEYQLGAAVFWSA